MDFAAAEIDIVIAELVAHGLLVFARQLQHRRIEIDADDFARGADDLANKVTGLAAPGAKIEDGLAGTNETRRIAAAVIFCDDFVRDDLEQCLVVAHRQAQTSFDFLCRVAIALQHRRFQVIMPIASAAVDYFRIHNPSDK